MQEAGAEVLGLSTREQAVYRALVQQPGSTAHDIAEAVEQTADSCRSVLVDLVEKGLAAQLREHRPARFHPLDPETALSSRIVRAQVDLDASRHTLADLSREFRRSPLGMSATAVVEVIVGADEVQQRLEALHASLTESRLGFDCPPYLADMTTDDAEIETERILLDRGVQVRSVYRPDAFELPGRYDTVRKLVGLGEQARTWASIPTKLLIFDRSTAILPLIIDEATATNVIVVKPSGLLDVILSLFEQAWSRATPIDPGRIADGGQVAPDLELSRIADLLCAGLTDRVVCHEAGISERTLRRRLDALFDRFHARTRFQAGFNLGRAVGNRPDV